MKIDIKRREVDFDAPEIDGDIYLDDSDSNIVYDEAVHLNYFDARAGGGKTTCMATVALRYAAMGRKVIISQISCALIEATYREHFAPGVIDSKYTSVPITRIHSEGQEGKVTARLMAHLRDGVPGGEIVMCTHAGHLGMPFVPARRNWHLIVDETPCPSRAYTLKISETHGAITDHIEAIPCEIPGYVELRMTSAAKIKRVAENVLQDEMFEVVQGLAKDLINPNVRCYAFEANYRAMLDGDRDPNKTKLHIFSELSPTIFEGYAEVVIISALFRDTMLYQSWNVASARWMPVDPKRWHVKYPEHENGNLLTIYYAGTRDYAKYQRTATVTGEDGQETIYIRNVMRRIENLFAGDAFLYSINKDMADDSMWDGDSLLTGEYIRSGTKLSGSPHGINDYKGWHNVAIITALNPTLQHINFHAARGIDSQAIKNAQYRQACYQIMCRCSLRDAQSVAPKRCVVMDKTTAEYLARMFPGCTVLPLPEIGSSQSELPPAKPKGRPAKHQDEAERAKAYRDRKAWRSKRKLELHAQIDGLEVNRLKISDHTSISPGYFEEWIQQEDMFFVTKTLKKKEEQQTHTSLKDFRDATNAQIEFPLFAHKRTNSPCLYREYGRDFLDYLVARSTRVVQSKDENELISTTMFVDRAGCDTKIGRENVEVTVGIWWDQDGETDLDAETFASWFPQLEMYIYATHSSTKSKPRWRAYMPTDFAMPGQHDSDLYWVIMRRLVEIVNEHGYWSEDEIAKGLAPKGAKRHGFDKSVWRPEAKIYLPCVPFDREGAISIRLTEGREPIILADWIDNHVNTILDKEDRPEPQERPAKSKSTKLTKITPKASSDDLCASDEAYIDRAMAAYDSRPTDTGHAEFWRLACRLGSTSLANYEIESRLQDAASRSGTSRQERRGEISGIMKRLDRSYTLRE